MQHAIFWALSVTLFAAVTTGSPGPNNTLLTASGARFGFVRTIPHMLGVTLGFPVLFLAIAFGLGVPLRNIPALFVIMRWVGLCYLLWLAWHIATERPSAGSADEARSLPQSGRRVMGFWQALGFQWVNPKAWIIAGSAFVAYTHPGPHLYAQILIVMAIFLLVTPVAVAAWTMVGVGSRRLISTPLQGRIFQAAMAGLLVLSLLPLAFEH